MSVHSHNTHYLRQHLTDILQWDVYTWKKALYYWDAVLDTWSERSRGLQGSQELQDPQGPQGTQELQVSQGPQGTQELQGLRALEIGARDGGLSLYLAQKGVQVTCSDIDEPAARARELHHQYGLDSLIGYAAIDATAIPFNDDSFDLVIFKSMLGAVGQFKGIPAVDTVINEVRRILKPGGLVLFAENQEGSRFHAWARHRFMPWGSTYYYIPQHEIIRLFSVFTVFEFKTYGFLACVKKDFLPLAILDHLICLSKRSKSNYMVYGFAIK